LGASYAAALGFSAIHDFNNGASWNFVPVVGPFGAIGAREFKCHQTDPNSNKCLNRAVDEVKAVTFLAIDGIVQVVGFTLMIVGTMDRKKELVRIDMPVSVLPIWVGSGYGVALGSSF
jgi:hypothetical protein